MHSGYPEHRFYNLPINVWWEGWRSTTLDLQRAGWQISVDQDIMRNTLRIALCHRKMNLYGLSKSMEYSYRKMHYQTPYDVERMLENEVINIVSIAPNIMVETLPCIDWSETKPRTFHAIDASPEVVDLKSPHGRIYNINEFAHFKIIEPDKEIIIPEQSVSDLIQEILKKQEPEQERYRQRMREEAALAHSRMPQRTVQAQIITLARAA